MPPDMEPSARSDQRSVDGTLAHYRHLAEFSLDGIIITDLEGRVLIANPAVLATMEIDSTTEKQLQDFFDFIAPESITEARRDFAGMREDRKGIVRTYKAISALGHDRYVEVLGNRILFEGSPANILSVRDATKRRQMEESLRRSEELYRLLAENSPDIITNVTPDLIVDYVSPAVEPLLGYKPYEVTGRNVLDGIHPEDRDLVEVTVRDVASGKDAASIEFRAFHKNGHILWFETTSRALRNNRTGELLELYNVSRDITGRKIAEETAHRRDRVLHGFASASGFLITGRLRNPIPRILSTIGDSMDADIAYIYEDSIIEPEGSRAAVRRYLWAREGEEDKTAPNKDFPGHRFPAEWSHRLASGTWISGCMSRFSGTDLEILRELGIQSVLLVPVFVRGAYWGFIGVSDLQSDRVWSDSEIEILMTLAAIIGLVFENRPDREPDFPAGVIQIRTE
jgi:PAS domain S-box-containing protein